MRLIKILLLSLLVFIVIPKYSPQTITSIKRWVNFSFCDRPIKYRIGSIDQKFEVTDKDFSATAAEAAKIWNKQYGKTLFEYDAKGELEINLVYDGRQKIITDINKLDAEVEKQKQQLESQNSAYVQAKTALENEIEELNKSIDYWNSNGGAPKKEYNPLVSKQKELKDKIDSLNNSANQLNNTVEKINNQVHDLNLDVGKFNSIIKVNPEVGEYTSGINKIDIFFFGSRNELIQVLAHEMGHALGLGHVNEDKAIMNPITSPNLEPTSADVDELLKICTNKNRIDLIKNDVINYTYTLISNFQK